MWICYSLYYKTYVRDQDYINSNMIIVLVLRYNIPTVIYELYGMSRITTGLLCSIFGLRVPDDGTTVTLSAVNAIGTQLRDPINPGLTRWRMAVS